MESLDGIKMEEQQKEEKEEKAPPIVKARTVTSGDEMYRYYKNLEELVESFDEPDSRYKKTRELSLLKKIQDTPISWGVVPQRTGL